MLFYLRNLQVDSSLNMHEMTIMVNSYFYRKNNGFIIK